MNVKKIRLQLYFICLAVFNFLYALLFPWFIRSFLLRLTGTKTGKRSCVQRVRFFGFGSLIIGNNSVINSGCYLDNRRGIIIGNNVVIAHDTKIYTLGHDVNDPSFKTKGGKVVIEDYVIIFSNVLIMPGVRIKKGAVILPGSVVTKDVEEMMITGGNPARPVKIREVLHSNKEPYNYWFSI